MILITSLLPHDSYLKAVGVTACNRAYWRADAKRESLQRVYAITFPDPKQLKEHMHRLEEVIDVWGVKRGNECHASP